MIYISLTYSNFLNMLFLKKNTGSTHGIIENF